VPDHHPGAAGAADAGDPPAELLSDSVALTAHSHEDGTVTELHVSRREPQGSTHETPLLFVHGAWHGAWCWEEHFLDHFAEQGFRVAALDLRGHGSSPARGRFRTRRLRHYVEDVAEVAATFDRPPVVVGHSMGGMVVQKYLEKHSAPAAVLVASGPPRGVVGITLRVLRHHPLTFLRMNATWSLYPLVADHDDARALLFSDRLDEVSALGYTAKLQDESYLAFLDMLLLDLPRPKRVSTPLLVLGGERDTIFPPPEVHATAKAYGTTAVMFDGGHDLMLEPVWPEVAAAISAWVSEWVPR
jgi:pimeloyl-ACP methyl ester carboxylesterase